jgi:hypothetical protein
MPIFGVALLFIASGALSGFMLNRHGPVPYLTGVPLAVACCAVFVRRVTIIPLTLALISLLWIPMWYLGFLTALADVVFLVGFVGACGITLVVAISRRALLSIESLGIAASLGALAAVPFQF